MSSTCGFPHDAVPASVHALLSLWGGFEDAAEGADSGLEKRLELDFAARLPSEVLCPAQLSAAMACAEQTVEHCTITAHVLAMTFTDSMAVLTPHKLVVTAASTVLLHRVLAPLLARLRACDVHVEWASFFRKNTTSPWVESCAMGDVMAQEYADLQAAFPRGRSLLVGPVDGLHFFHFVYDDVRRDADTAATVTATRVEADVQLNVFLFGVRDDAVSALLSATTTTPTPTTTRTAAAAAAAASDAAATPTTTTTTVVHKADAQQLTLLGGDEYEMLRVSANGPCVSFDTNAASAVASAARVQCLLDTYQPRHFTLVALQDRDTPAEQLRRNLSTFAGYHVQNRTVNYFAEAYAFHQLVFHRDAG